MTREITFAFTDIPSETRFVVLEDATQVAYNDLVPVGNTTLTVTIPDDWTTPQRRLHSFEHTIPGETGPIPDGVDHIEVTGANYYSDVTRPDCQEALNRRSVEELIYKTSGAGNLDGRQKFYSALLALESYFEFLTFGMLALSGHRTEAQTHNMTQANRINQGFGSTPTGDAVVVEFFAAQLELCPGKVVPLQIFSQAQREKMRDIFHMIRQLRNSVVHSWCTRNIERIDLRDQFANVGEVMNITGSDEEFYAREAFLFTRLYVRATNGVGNQVLLFNEKSMIERERRDRGL